MKKKRYFDSGCSIPFLELKDLQFEYCGKTYIQKRFISEDFIIFIRQDDLDYVRVYTGDWRGENPTLLYDLYHEGNPCSYPIYTLEDAMKKFLELKDSLTLLPLNVHPSQFKS